MLKLTSLVLGATAMLSAAVALGPMPAIAQNGTDGATSYAAGVDLGRTLNDPRECTGSGNYRDGCVDGVTEHRFDREADQALGSDFGSDAKPAEPAPLLSPPPDLFHEPLSKPDDGAPPNN